MRTMADHDSFPASDTKKFNAWVDEVPHPLRGRAFDKTPGLYEDYAVLIDTTGTPTSIAYGHVLDLRVKLETPYSENDPPARVMMDVHYIGVDDVYGRSFVFDESVHAPFGLKVIKAKMALKDQCEGTAKLRNMVHWEDIWRNYWRADWEGQTNVLTKFTLFYLADEPFSNDWTEAWTLNARFTTKCRSRSSSSPSGTAWTTFLFGWLLRFTGVL